MEQLVAHVLTSKGITAANKIVYVERGKSMVPTILPHSVVTIKPLRTKKEKSSLKTGDIIFFRLPNSFHCMLHRIRHIRTSHTGTIHIITKGDAKRFEDPPITESHVLGTIVSVQYNGTVYNPMQKNFLSFVTQLRNRLFHSRFTASNAAAAKLSREFTT